MVTHYSKRISGGFRFLLIFLTLSSLLAIPVISGMIPADQTNPAPSYQLISQLNAVEKNSVPNYVKPRIYLKNTLSNGHSLTFSTGFFVIWGLGFLIMGFRILTGIMGMYRLLFIMRNQDSVPMDLYPGMMMKVASRTGLHTPITCGLFRPIVILPAGVAEWTATQKLAVLYHETAHIKRYDNLTNLLAQIIVAVYWFNPLAWIALNELRINREKACDDYVLNAGIKPSIYAGILLESIRTNNHPSFRNRNLITLQFYSKGEKRLKYILDAKIHHNLLRGRVKLLMLLVTLMLVIPLSAIKLLGAEEPDATQPHIGHLDSRPVITMDGPNIKMTFTGENNQLINLSGPRTEFPIGWPEKDTHSRIASPFGFFFHPIFKKRTHHDAVDIVSPFRTPIVATAEGTVTIAEFWGGYGKCIEIQHHYFSTRFGHLDAINVTPGDMVKQGDVIGYSGNTGYTTGPHLHYEIRYNAKALNPEYFLDAVPAQ